MDHETTPQYVLTVTVSDDADPALSDEATVTIDVTDVNEAPSADDAVFSVAEDSAAAAVVGRVTASDPDAGQALGYAISAGNGGGAFAIDGSGGITVAGALDHETTPQYVLTVTVSDDADPALSDEATVTIDVTDVNEAPSADDAVFSIAEDSAAAAVVGRVTASDPDAGQTLGYAISAGNGGGAFAIDGSGGITVAGALDHETTPQYVLTVTVSDDADPALSDEATVTIDVTDVNEAPSADDAVFSIAEDSAAAAVVGSVTASDPDAGQTLGYAISAGNGGGAFAIDGSGGITVAGALDHETTPQYVLTVTVSDDADPALSDEATVTIDVTDVNEAPVAYPQSVSVEEDGSLQIVLTGSDPDEDELDFEVTVDPEHGVVTGTAPNLTYTPTVNYHGPDSLTFVVTDGAEESPPAVVTITVESNAPPGFDLWLAGFGLTAEPNDDSDLGGLDNLPSSCSVTIRAVEPTTALSGSIVRS